MSTVQARRVPWSESRSELCVREAAGLRIKQAHDLSRLTTSAGPWPQQAHNLSRPAASAQGCRGKQVLLEQ